MPNYDKRAFNWFLTYSQCQLLPDQFNDCFWANSKIADCIGFVIAREPHTNGGWHYHCLVSYSSPCRVRTLTAFDLDYAGARIHGNYQVVKDLPAVYEYVTKGGDYFEDVDEVPGIRPVHETNYWELALQQSSKEEALKVIRRHNPRDYILNMRNLDYAFDKHFEVREELAGPAFAREAFTSVPIELDNWYANELCGGQQRPKSLILVGPSRTGKTSWARSLGEHVYIMSQLIPAALKNRPRTCKYIVFDDIEQGTLDKSQLASSWKVFLGAQEFLTVNEKYKPVETINWGIPSIWCLNSLLDFPDKDFVAANCITIFLNNKLY